MMNASYGFLTARHTPRKTAGNGRIDMHGGSTRKYLLGLNVL